MDSTWCVELSLYLCFQSGAKLLEYPFSRTCWSNRPQFIWDDRLMHLCSTDEKNKQEMSCLDTNCPEESGDSLHTLTKRNAEGSATPLPPSGNCKVDF